MSENEFEVRPVALLASTESEARKAERDGRVSFVSFKILLLCWDTTIQGEQAVLGWVKAGAIARIVHGDGHWRCAQCHVRTARCYLDLQGKRLVA